MFDHRCSFMKRNTAARTAPSTADRLAPGHLLRVVVGLAALVRLQALAADHFAAIAGRHHPPVALHDGDEAREVFGGHLAAHGGAAPAVTADQHRLPLHLLL